MPDISCIIGEHTEAIKGLKEDLKKIQEDQKEILDFVREQKTARKYIWLLFIVVSGILTFSNSILSFLAGFFSIKGHIIK